MGGTSDGGVRGGVGRREGGVRDGSNHREGRGGAGQDLSLHQCRSCGLDCGTTASLYRHVAVRCLARLGESMQEYRRKHQLQQHAARYQQRQEERRAQARQQVSQSPHLILGTFGQYSSMLGQKFWTVCTTNKFKLLLFTISCFRKFKTNLHQPDHQAVLN